MEIPHRRSPYRIICLWMNPGNTFLSKISQSSLPVVEEDYVLDSKRIYSQSYLRFC